MLVVDNYYFDIIKMLYNIILHLIGNYVCEKDTLYCILYYNVRNNL